MKRYIFLHLLMCWLLYTPAGHTFPFVYLSDNETSPDGEYIPWASTDSVIGDMYINDCMFCDDGAPTIDGYVFMGCSESMCDLGDTPVYTSAREHTLTDYMFYVRNGAAQQGNVFGSRFPHYRQQFVASIRGDRLLLRYADEGVPYDSLTWHSLYVPFGPFTCYVYIYGPLRISGELDAQGIDLVIGCSRDLWIDDNIVIEGTNLENAELPPDANPMIALASEGSIFIRNTWANGRANSEAGSDVVVTAVLISNSEEGGLRLDQPNDFDDSYICPCTPDLRGTFRLNGALVQRRRGEWINDNNGGTGYRIVLKYDERLYTHGIIFSDHFTQLIEPDTLLFGDVNVGESRQEFITIRSYFNFNYSGTLISYPFSAPSSFQYTDSIAIPVTFTPPYPINYSGFVSFYLSGVYHEIPLRGSGIDPPESQGFTASAHPNPFNAVTSLSLNLPNSGELRIILYDILGREVEQLAFNNLQAGQQLIRLDMSQHASGVYFANLQSGDNLKTLKLLLMK